LKSNLRLRRLTEHDRQNLTIVRQPNWRDSVEEKVQREVRRRELWMKCGDHNPPPSVWPTQAQLAAAEAREAYQREYFARQGYLAFSAGPDVASWTRAALQEEAEDRRALRRAARQAFDSITASCSGAASSSAAAAPASGSAEEEVQIFVKMVDGSQTVVRCRLPDSVAKFKELLEEASGYPADKQRLNFGGKQLDDDKTLTADYFTFTTTRCTSSTPSEG